MPGPGGSARARGGWLGSARQPPGIVRRPLEALLLASFPWLPAAGMKPPGGAEERGAGALLRRRPTAAGGKRSAEHCRQTGRRPGGTAGTRRDAPRPRNPLPPQPAGGAPRYSHFVRQPRVRRQRDLEGNLGPEGEREGVRAVCRHGGPRRPANLHGEAGPDPALPTRRASASSPAPRRPPRPGPRLSPQPGDLTWLPSGALPETWPEFSGSEEPPGYQ